MGIYGSLQNWADRGWHLRGVQYLLNQAGQNLNFTDRPSLHIRQILHPILQLVIKPLQIIVSLLRRRGRETSPQKCPRLGFARLALLFGRRFGLACPSPFLDGLRRRLHADNDLVVLDWILGGGVVRLGRVRHWRQLLVQLPQHFLQV